MRTGEITVPTVLYAREQSAGRGTRGRVWHSQPGNFQGSFVFPLPDDWENPGLIVYPIALATRAVIAEAAPSAVAHVKWPNDILLNGAKCSGSLHETVHVMGRRWFVGGIGVNLRWKPPEGLIYAACALADHTGETPSVDAFARKLATAIAHWIRVWHMSGFAAICCQYLNVAAGYRDTIEVRLRGDYSEPLIGVFVDINENGGLVLQCKGEKKVIYAADIFPGF